MKQEEFETQLKELRSEKERAVGHIALMQSDIEGELAGKRKVMNEFATHIQKLKEQKYLYAKRRMEVETEWNEKIRRFKKENFTQTRKLEEVSDWALVNELRHRGYGGQLTNADRDEEWLQELMCKFNGGHTETGEEEGAA